MFDRSDNKETAFDRSDNKETACDRSDNKETAFGIGGWRLL